MTRLKGVIVFVVGVAVLVGGALNAWRAFTIGSEGTAVTGTVFDVQHHPRARRRPAYDEAFVRVTVEGRDHECSFEEDDPVIGAQLPVEVAFVDGEITCEREGSNWKNWALAGGLLCCFGPLALLIGLVMMFGEKEKRAEGDFR